MGATQINNKNNGGKWRVIKQDNWNAGLKKKKMNSSDKEDKNTIIMYLFQYQVSLSVLWPSEIKEKESTYHLSFLFLYRCPTSLNHIRFVKIARFLFDFEKRSKKKKLKINSYHATNRTNTKNTVLIHGKTRISVSVEFISKTQ